MSDADTHPTTDHDPDSDPDPDPDPDATGAFARVRRFLGEHGLWLSAALTAVVFAAMVAYADAGQVRRAFAGFDWEATAGVLGLATAGYVIRLLKWECYLRELDVDVSPRTSAVVFFSGLMMVVTPGKAGELWKAWFLRDTADVPVSTTSSVVGAERATDLLALCGLAAVGLAAYSRSSTVLVAVGAAFALGLGLLRWRSGCRRLLARAESVPVVGRYAGDIETFYESTYALFRLRPLATATALSVVAWGLEGLALWVALRGFGVPADPLVGVFVFSLGSVVGAASLLPGGLGAAEASMLGLLLTFGYSEPVAAGATIVVRVGTLWYAAGLGVVTFTLYRLLSTRAAESVEA